MCILVVAVLYCYWDCIEAGISSVSDADPVLGAPTISFLDTARLP